MHPLREGDKILENAEGTPLRDFPFLPRYISVQVPGWLLEYWFRTDQRLSYKDIIARMVGQPENLPSKNSLNMRRERDARAPLGLSCWPKYHSHISKAELIRLEGWTLDQISYNTTMDIEYLEPPSARPTPFRLCSKTLVNDAPTRYYPLDTFLENGQRHVPSPRITATLNLFYKLAEQALKEGLDSWEDLYVKELAVCKTVPKTSKRASNSKVEESKRGRRVRVTSPTSDR